MSYQVLNLEQGTPEWLEARRKRVTASKTPVILGVSEYQTPLQLWEEMVLGVEPDNSGKDYLFAKGHAAEAAGRTWISQNLGLELKPSVLLRGEILASLDGHSEDASTIAEFKLLGREHLKALMDGVMKPSHRVQVQTQLWVSGAEKAIYFATDPDGNAAMLEVEPDEPEQSSIVTASAEFMELVKSLKAPEPTDKDWFTPDPDERFELLAELDAKKKAIESEYKKLSESVKKDYGKYRRVRAGPVTLIQCTRSSVAYSEIPELQGVDLSPYTRVTEYAKLSVKGGKK